jgi:cytochrome c
MTCHTLEKDGPNKVGPNLWGVVDRPRASHPGFDYSAAMKGKGGKWTFDKLDKFLAHPQGYIPGTKMTFSGIQNADQRANLIACLRTRSDNPVPLPEAAAPASAGSEQEPSQQNDGRRAPEPKLKFQVTRQIHRRPISDPSKLIAPICSQLLAI